MASDQAWERLKQRAVECWPPLSRADLEACRGDDWRLVLLVQSRCGLTRRRAVEALVALQTECPPDRSTGTVLYPTAVLLILLWLLGVGSSDPMSRGFIPTLLVVAVVMILVRLVGGRRPVV